MERNPYSPPQAAVADVAELDNVADRPREVKIAVTVLWVGVALGAVGGIAQRLSYVTMPLPTFLLAQAIGMAIAAWFIGKLGRGRNWARILFLVVMALGAIGAMFSASIRTSFLRGFRPGSSVIIISICRWLLDFAALALLFTRPAGAWFKRHH